MQTIAELIRPDEAVAALRDPDDGTVKLWVRDASGREAAIRMSPAEWHDFIFQLSPHSKRTHQGPPA